MLQKSLWTSTESSWKQILIKTCIYMTYIADFFVINKA